MSDPADPVQDRPLAGLEVIELHAIGPVPFAGMVLRQLGAQVTRVSPPRDPGLGLTTLPAFDLLNRGKRALALDLKQPADRQAMGSQLTRADVLLPDSQAPSRPSPCTARRSSTTTMPSPRPW